MEFFSNGQILLGEVLSRASPVWELSDALDEVIASVRKNTMVRAVTEVFAGLKA